MNWIPQDDLHELKIATDVLVMPSRWEALPISLIEGMAAHLHVVATRVGGIEDVLKKYERKTYIEGFSAKHIVLAIETALTEIIENGLKTIDDEYVKQFDWSRVFDRIELVYDELRGR